MIFFCENRKIVVRIITINWTAQACTMIFHDFSHAIIVPKTLKLTVCVNLC